MTNSHNLNKFTTYVLPLTTALIICRAFPVLSFFYYAVPFILILSFIFYLLPFLNLYHNLNPAPVKTTAGELNRFARDKRLKTLLLLIAAFGLWAAITSLWSPFPGVTLSRAAYFLLISIAPLLLGFLWSKNKKNEPFTFLLPANIIVVVVSMYSFVTSSPANAWTGGHGLGFMGYAGHQNTLAAAIVFTIPSVVYPVLTFLKTKLERVKESDLSSFHISRLPSHVSLLSFYLLLFLLNLYLLILSVSRAGVLTLIFMILLFILLSFNKKAALTMMLLLISAFATFFYSSQSVREFVFKTESTIGDRRIVNIRETINAAKNGGLFGLGYGISQQPGNERVRGHYEQDGKLFIREKMIGTLALVEETGIVGFGLFLAPIVFVFWGLVRVVLGKMGDGGWRMEDGPARRTGGSKKIDLPAELAGVKMEAAFMIAVLIGFCFHAQIEAWWIGVGSVELPLFFILLGCGLENLLSYLAID